MKKLITGIFISMNLITYAQKNAQVKITLRDENVISGISSFGDITFQTSYGKLLLPIRSVNSFEIGIGKDKNIYDKATSYLKALEADKNPANKKVTYSELVKLGAKAVPAINDFLAESAYMPSISVAYPVEPYPVDIAPPTIAPAYTDEEAPNVANTEEPDPYTPESALEELKAIYGIDESTPINDIVMVDNEYTIGGAYDFQKLDVKTEYGTLSVPKGKIKTIEIISIVGSNNESTFRLSAAKHISSNPNGGWIKTGIVLKQGQKFTLSSSGQITLASMNNQKYTPQNSYDDYPTYGNVVYKIGENSELKKAGKKQNGVAETTGMLYISIYESMFYNGNTGFYIVKITK